MEKRAGRTKSELTAHSSDYARRISGKKRKKLYAQVDTYVNSAHSPNSTRETTDFSLERTRERDQKGKKKIEKEPDIRR